MIVQQFFEFGPSLSIRVQNTIQIFLGPNLDKDGCMLIKLSKIEYQFSKE